MAWILVVSPPRVLRRAQDEGRWLGRRPFFSRPGAMLMGADDGGVDHHVFLVVICRQHLENVLENTAFAPSPEAPVRRLPIAEPFRKIAPRDAGAVAIQHRLYEGHVRRCPADMAFAARQP